MRSAALPAARRRLHAGLLRRRRPERRPAVLRDAYRVHVQPCAPRIALHLRQPRRVAKPVSVAVCLARHRRREPLRRAAG
eukprot:1955154-Pleurochrysis_carterae.AAC.2